MPRSPMVQPTPESQGTRESTGRGLRPPQGIVELDRELWHLFRLKQNWHLPLSRPGGGPQTAIAPNTDIKSIFELKTALLIGTLPTLNDSIHD